MIIVSDSMEKVLSMLYDSVGEVFDSVLTGWMGY